MMAARFATTIRPDRSTGGYRVVVVCGRSGCAGRFGTVWLPPAHVTGVGPRWQTSGAWLLDDRREPPRWRQPAARHPKRRFADYDGPDLPETVTLPAVAECPACHTVQAIELPTPDPLA